MARSKDSRDEPIQSEPRDRAPEVRDLAEAAFADDAPLFFGILARRLEDMKQAGWTEQEAQRWAEGVCEILGMDPP